MLKLFWNTANNSSFDNNLVDSSKFRWKGNIWGEYHKNNSNKWIFFLIEKTRPKIVQNLNEINSGDELIIIDSSVEKKINFYTKLNLICSKIFLFHLGDEIGLIDTKNIYEMCKHSWRIFCTNIYFDSKNVTCIPLGYKSGVREIINDKNYQRTCKWTFTGTVHKSSRHDLLYQLGKINPNFVHKTEKFAEKGSLDSNEISKILSNTEFVPCPNGVVHPETYRLYEALECGCIPIVEKIYDYYDRLFPKNPFFKVNKWIEAKDFILDLNQNDIQKKQIECKKWWMNTKNELQNKISKTINL